MELKIAVQPTVKQERNDDLVQKTKAEIEAHLKEPDLKPGTLRYMAAVDRFELDTLSREVLKLAERFERKPNEPYNSKARYDMYVSSYGAIYALIHRRSSEVHGYKQAAQDMDAKLATLGGAINNEEYYDYIADLNRKLKK